MMAWGEGDDCLGRRGMILAGERVIALGKGDWLEPWSGCERWGCGGFEEESLAVQMVRCGLGR